MRKDSNSRPQPVQTSSVNRFAIALAIAAVIGVGVLAFVAGKQSGLLEAAAAKEKSSAPAVATAPPASAPAAPANSPSPAPPGSRPNAPALSYIVDPAPRGLSAAPTPPPAPTPAPAPTAEPAKTLAFPIAWDEARTLMRAANTVLVDARHKPDYDAGHIPGAISLPQGSSPEEFAAFKAKIPADRLIIAYCAGESCSLSKLLAEELANNHGYKSVRYWTGGFREWNEREPNAPLEKSPEAATAAAMTATPATTSAPSALAAPSIVVTPSASPTPAAPSALAMTWDEAKMILTEIVLVDARSKADFDAGHIPGAISLPQASTPEEFQAFKSHYPTEKKIVVYCSSTSCPVSKQVADKLMAEFSYTQVWYMAGGFQAWQQAQAAAKTN